MKKLAIVLGLSGSMVAAPAIAMDIPVAGQTLSLGAENDINYTTGIEEWNWELTPSAGIAYSGINFSVETTIDMFDLNADEVFTGLDYVVDYTLPATNVKLYSELSSDPDFEFSDITMGARITF
jgi:hypothetical protein